MSVAARRFADVGLAVTTPPDRVGRVPCGPTVKNLLTSANEAIPAFFAAFSGFDVSESTR